MNSIATFGHSTSKNSLAVYGFSKGTRPITLALLEHHGRGIHEIRRQKIKHIFHFTISVQLLEENKKNIKLSLTLKSNINKNIYFRPKISIFQKASYRVPISTQITQNTRKPLSIAVYLSFRGGMPFELATSITKSHKIQLEIMPKRHILMDPHDLALLLNEN